MRVAFLAAKRMTERSGGSMEDMISREKAINELCRMLRDCFGADDEELDAVTVTLNELPSAQPEKRTEERTETHACDLISRKDAIEAHYEYCNKHPDAGFPVWSLKILKDLPSAQPVAKDINVPVKDCISRKAAIELVKDVCDAIMSGCESRYDPETEDEVYTDIREVDAILKCNKEVRIALRNMPSAQPEITECPMCPDCPDNCPLEVEHD